MFRNAKSILFLKYLGFSIGPLLLLVAIGFVFIVMNQRLAQQNTERITNETLALLQANISMLLDELDAISISTGTDQQLFFSVRSISSEPHLSFENNQLLRRISTSLKTTVHSRPYLSSIYYYVDNPHGVMVSTDRSFGPARPANDPDWLDVFDVRRFDAPFSLLVARTIHHVDLPGFERRVLSLYRGAYRMGRLLAEGVVVLNVDLEYLENLVDGIRVFDRQTIIITDESGRALLSVGPEKLIHLELSTVLGNSDAVDHRFAGRHPEYFVTTHHPDGSGWGYVSLVPRADVYRIPMRMLRTSVGVFGIGSVIAVVLMVILSRRSFLQIGHLVDLIEDVERSGEPVHPEFRGKKSEIRENLTYSLMRNFVEAQLLPIKDSEQRYRRKTLQLLAMQSQVSPHFLFNTLETITWKSYRFTDGPNEVTEVLEKLAEVLEYALTRTGETVTLDDELSVARRYIEIQQVRYRELFEIEWEIDHGLTDAVVLPMILLPLLENAIYHGLRNVEKHGKIVVSVEARDEKSVELVVRDNGDGITRKKLDEINHRLKHDSSAVEHIGLYNTNKRIELAFGAPFGLSIESVENVGTSVTVALPLLFG